MEKINLSNWSEPAKESGLLFFAEAMIEMLFHHSHDSLKVNTLNFKTFWYDLLSVIDVVEEGYLDKGNLEPFAEEMKIFYSNDIAAQMLYAPDISYLFRKKDSSGKYVDRYSELFKNRSSDNTISIYKSVGNFIVDDLNCKDKYYNYLIGFICTLCKCRLGFEQERDLYKLTQSLMSELLYRGYSQEYIYQAVRSVFFSDDAVVDVDVCIEKFQSYFSFMLKQYIVYFPLTLRAKSQIGSGFILTVCENVYEMFGNQFPFIGRLQVEAYDPEQARTRASEIVGLIFAVIQYQQHTQLTFIVTSAHVIDLETSQCYKLKKPLPPMKRGNGNDLVANFVKENCPHQIPNLFNALELHSSALRSVDINNQLLNLWTAIEVLVPVERSGSFSKINQLCNVLSSVLASSYLRSLVIHLFNSLHIVCDAVLENVLSGIEADQEYLKLALALSLPEYKTNLATLKKALAEYPVLRYRLDYYSSFLSDFKILKQVYFTHVTKIRCQIMRIYRCRNMVVHDGSSAKYIELIIQNLHFYFDTLVDTIYYHACNGLWDLDSIFQKVSHHEVIIEDIIEKGIVSRDTILAVVSLPNPIL